MKKQWLAIPLFVAFFVGAANANPYLRLGYGVGSISTSEESVFAGSAQNVRLTPNDSSDGVWDVSLGYRVRPNFAFELGVQQFRSDAEAEIYVSGSTLFLQDNYDSELKGLRFSLLGVYLRDINPQLQMHIGAGLSMTNYDITASSYQDMLDDIPVGAIPGVTNPAPRSERAIGGVATIGLDYQAWQNITFGVGAKFGIDSIATTAQLFGTVGVRF
ncbi:MAG: AcfA family outer membrane beta-barrel protein [Vibrionaceae bacterium]